MRLSLSERWKLHRIEAAIRRSDPRLAALLAVTWPATAPAVSYGFRKPR